jgi:hypothetical protein
MPTPDPLREVRETQQFDAMRAALSRAVNTPTADELTRRERRRRRRLFRKRPQI